jgi:nicotinamidase-related amidase
MDAARTALILGDLQNNFLHPEGSYHRHGHVSAAAGALPGKLAPLARAARERGILVIATLFTLVPGRGGEPIVTPELKALRPFLAKGDFAPGSFGQQLVDALQPADIFVEKVTYSAFHMTRLEWVLRKCSIEHLYFTGIVTNVGVSTTVRDAHMREYKCTVVEDGCAAFREEDHRAAIGGLRSVARIISIAEALAEFRGGSS